MGFWGKGLRSRVGKVSPSTLDGGCGKRLINVVMMTHVVLCIPKDSWYF